MLLRLRSITYLAERINGYELVDPDERDLPPFEAGAHISVRVGDDLGGHLVHRSGGRVPGPDVEVLADAVPGGVPDRPLQERPVLPGR